MNHAFQTGANLINVHLVNFFYIEHIENDAMNCNDFHMQILYQIPVYNSEYYSVHDSYKKISWKITQFYSIHCGKPIKILTIYDIDFRRHSDKHQDEQKA